MHDIGRTQLELGETELGELGELGQTEFGELGELGELETAGEAEGPLGENTELELASELLEVTNEQELEQFLGNLVRAVGRGVGAVVNHPVTRAIGRVLKDTAVQSLPVFGTALAQSLGSGMGTGLVTRMGLGTPAPAQRRQRRPSTGGQARGRQRVRREVSGHVFGLELEGLSHEDREFEIAKQFVRFASTAAHNALTSGPTSRSPLATARAAAVTAAARHAPGLVPMLRANTGVAGTGGMRGAQSGRWVRRGRSIVLIGI